MGATVGARGYAQRLIARLTAGINRLAPTLLDRLRLFFLIFALGNLVFVIPPLTLSSSSSAPIRLAAAGAAGWLAWRWISWFRTGRRQWFDLPAELLAFLALGLVEGAEIYLIAVLFLGLFYRALFGGVRQIVAGATAFTAVFLIALIVTDRPLAAQELVVIPGIFWCSGVIYMLARMARDNARVLASVAEAEERHRLLIERLPATIFIEPLDPSQPMLFLSSRAEEMFGYPLEQMLANRHFMTDLIHLDDRERWDAEVARTDATGEPFSLEFRMLTNTGQTLWVHVEAVLVHDQDAEPRFWQGYITDISAQKRMADQMLHQAFHDPLTDLPNRWLFMDRLEHAVAQLAREERPIAVLFLDLDNFKLVNDSLGHRVGDELLVMAANRLTKTLRKGDTVARLGGDEFTILLEHLDDDQHAQRIADRIAERLAAPFRIGEQHIYATASIGITFAASAATSPDELLRQADMAMYDAKRGGKARYALFDPAMEQQVSELLSIEADLRHAADNGELTLYYQPVLELATGRIVEVEALLRWNHPHRGLLTPEQFIPIAEETGLLLGIDRWVLRAACRQVRAWQLSIPERAQLVVSVNMTSAQLRQLDLVHDVKRVLKETGLPPECLKFEIAERVITADMRLASGTLQELRALGVRIVIDDFGAGASALNYLRNFPIDGLKLDRSFVTGYRQNENETILVETLVTLAKTLGLTVTAEGIEEERQVELRELGCDFGQGFLFSHPLPPDALAELLQTALATPLGVIDTAAD